MERDKELLDKLHIGTIAWFNVKMNQQWCTYNVPLQFNSQQGILLAMLLFLCTLCLRFQVQFGSLNEETSKKHLTMLLFILDIVAQFFYVSALLNQYKLWHLMLTK